MNKSDLIEYVADSTGLDRRQAKAAVECVFEGMSRCLADGESCTITGFGTFGVTMRAARNGFNPHSKTHMRVEPTRAIKFTASAGLKDILGQAKPA